MGDIAMSSVLEVADGAKKEVMDISKIVTRDVLDETFKRLVVEQSDVLTRNQVNSEEKHIHTYLKTSWNTDAVGPLVDLGQRYDIVSSEKIDDDQMHFAWEVMPYDWRMCSEHGASRKGRRAKTGA